MREAAASGQTHGPGASATPLPALRRWLASVIPDLADRRFWLVQALVLGIAVLHDIIEIAGLLPRLGPLFFLPITLFALPVVYAGLSFGFRKALATSAWVTALTVPNWFLWHSGWERVGVIMQFSVIVTISLLVGWRVDRERGARKHAESVSEELRVSQARYLHLFETSPLVS